MKTERLILVTMLIMGMMTATSLAADRVSLGFIYGANDQVDLVDRTNGAINQVAPTCFNLDTKGNLVITADLTQEFVNEMKEREILITPFLSNHWVRSKGRAAIKNAENLTNQLVEAIEKYQLDGVNVDIENLTPEDRDQLSTFVEMLREKMPENKILSVSVAANPEAKENGWQGSYDYARLGKVADYLFVMTYDEHSQGGACGPVASLDFIKKSVEYALQYVSKDKIVMGIPFYGRYWKEGEETGGEAIVIGAMSVLLSKTQGIVKYNAEIGEACVKFQISNPQIKVKINGKELEDGNYTVWYSNEESIKSKLSLVNEYNLLGAGVWALGQEKVEVWSYYKKELNRIPYVSPDERKQEEREAYEAIKLVLENLEKPDLHPFSYQVEEEEKIRTTMESEGEKMKTEIAKMYEKEQQKQEDMRKVEIAKNIAEKINLDSNQKIKEEIVEARILHIYQYCRKE